MEEKEGWRIFGLTGQTDEEVNLSRQVGMGGGKHLRPRNERKGKQTSVV